MMRAAWETQAKARMPNRSCYSTPGLDAEGALAGPRCQCVDP